MRGLNPIAPPLRLHICVNLRQSADQVRIRVSPLSPFAPVEEFEQEVREKTEKSPPGASVSVDGSIPCVLNRDEDWKRKKKKQRRDRSTCRSRRFGQRVWGGLG